MKNFKELKSFLILWSTQSLSQLGSSMTAFALTLWLFDQTGSALETALLQICSYAPYVVMSIFAGALSDRWDKKRTMLVCDALAALSTIAVLVMLKTNTLLPWHLYLLNALSGLMNTVQRPASDVALSLIVPKAHYQTTSGMQSFANSLITIFNPILATAVYALLGMDAVIAIDLATFAIAFGTLWLAVPIPKAVPSEGKAESLLASAKVGLRFLRHHPMLLWLILFLAAVNFVASAFNGTLPAFVLSNSADGQMVLGVVSAFSGIGMLVGSLIATLMPKPKNRVRVISLTMLFSLGTENFLLAFAKMPALWCAAQFIGWCMVPVMNASLDVVLRSSIPVELQGRVYACRNSLQFFTIPLGLFFGGWMVDDVCGPMMQSMADGSALMMFILGILGTVICLIFGRILRKYTFVEA